MKQQTTTESQPSEQGRRIAIWDNLKAFLIICVVLGHMIDYFETKQPVFKQIFFFIYLFHMPLFFFISGLFSKSVIRKEQFPSGRIIHYFILYLILNIANRFAEDISANGLFAHANMKNFTLIGTKGAAWFLFVLPIFLCLTRLLRRVAPGLVLSVSILTACFAGYDAAIGDAFCLSRIFVFYPFFYLGYWLNPEQVCAVTHKKSSRIASVVVLLAAVGIVLFGIKHLYDYRPLLTGRNPFSEIPHSNLGFLIRGFYYVAVAVLSFAIISLTPQKNTIFTKTGQRTLQIYCYHRVLVSLFVNLGGVRLLKHLAPSAWIYLYMACALVIVFLLTWKPLGTPIQKLKEWCNTTP